MDISSKMESLKALHQMNESMKGAIQHNLCDTTMQLFFRAINSIVSRIYEDELGYTVIKPENNYCSGDQIASYLFSNPNSTWVIQYITDLCNENAYRHNQDENVNELYNVEMENELFQDIGFLNFSIIAGEIMAPMTVREEKCDGNCKQCKHFKKDVYALFDNGCCQDAVAAYYLKHYFYHQETKISKKSYIEKICCFLMDTSLEILGIEFDPSHNKIDCEEIVRGQFALLFAWGFYWLPDNYSGHISIFYNSHSIGVLEYCQAIKEGKIDDAGLTEEERSLAAYCYETLSHFSVLCEQGNDTESSAMYYFPDGREGEYILLIENNEEIKDMKQAILNYCSLQEYLAVVDVARLTFGERIEQFNKERSSCNLK